MTKYTEYTERLVRLLMFVLASSILIRYVSGIELSDYDQLKLVTVATVSFMFVNTYYPKPIDLNTQNLSV